MVPRIHSTGGHSFKGCMNYLLHGQELEAEQRNQAVKEDPRVAWSMTGNLGTRDPATAARVMAATAKNKDKLKVEAGVSNRGRPSTLGDVMHYTLSWREDEIQGLSQAEMRAAALASLKKLGKDTTNGKEVPKDGGRRQFADEHQFVLVCHDDKKHPHVHIMVNMTHPKTGRRLPTSNDQRKLSSWAKAYQKKHGNEHLCPAREDNSKAIAREQKKKKEDREFIKAEKSLNRSDWELQQGVQHSMVKTALQKKYREQAATIAKAARDQKARHARQWQALQQDHQKKQAVLCRQSAQSFQETKRQLFAASNRKLAQLGAERDADVREFKLRERSWQGRLKNTWSALKHQGWKVLNTEQERGLFSKVFRTVFNLHADPTARMRPIQDKHDKIEAAHHKKTDIQIAQAKQQQDARRNEQLQAGRAAFGERRKNLIAKQNKEAAQVQGRWKQYGFERRTAWKILRERYPLNPGERKPGKQTNPAHLFPKEGSHQAAKNIDQHYRNIAKQLKRDAEVEAKEKGQGKSEGRGR